MRLSLLASLSAALLAAPSVLASPVRRANPAFPDPNIDPFYAIPANASSYANGAVIRSRPVDTNIALNVGQSFQVLYKSTNTKNGSDATVATVWTPSKPVSPPKLFSYQSYEDSVQLNCAPSWAFVKNTASANTAITSLDTPIYIEWALGQGYYVVASDHEGSQAAFIAGFQEGMAALDGIRAAQKQVGLPANTPVVLFGYSGGAHATAWAANLAGPYAPEINIVGAAHGGTPIDARNLFNFLNKGIFAGFAGGGLVGLMNAYPELNDYVLANVNDDGRTRIQQYRAPNYCLANVASGAPFVDFLSLINVADPLNQPIPKAVLARETLLSDVSSVGVSVPKFPKLQFHALLDEIVPYADELKFVGQQCARGANIQFQTLPVAEHITGEIFGIVGAIIFIQQAFQGTTPKVLCGTGIPDFSTIFSSNAADVLGADTVARLRSLNGTKTSFGSTINFPS